MDRFLHLFSYLWKTTVNDNHCKLVTGGISDLEEHIKCSVCFEVYRNPHALPCLHTFCNECINQLEKHGKVECPHCREVCNMKQVRKDFKTQALIDSRNARQQEGPGQTGSLCGMCGEQGMAVVSHCASCDHVMCARCQGIHGKMKATKSHPVKSLKDFLAASKAPYNDAIQMLKHTKNNYDSSSENVASILRSINQDKEEDIKQFDEHIEKIRTSIHRKINIVCANAKDILMENKALTDKKSKDIELQINFLMGITENNNICTLKTMESQLESITDEAQQMSLRVFTQMTSPVTFQLRDVNPESLVDVAVAEAIMNTQKINYPQVIAQDFHKMDSQKYKKVASVDVGVYVQRMRMISGRLYCAADNGIHIYNQDLTLMRKITSDKLGHVRSMAQCEQTGDLIVACDGFEDQGVHQLTPEGDYITCVTAFGEFSDVCSHHGRLFALDYKQCTIRVFDKRTDVWSETVRAHIQLRYSNGCHFDKMVVTEDSVFVSSCNNHCVYEYSLISRQHLRQLGRPGQSGPGELDSPVICDVDTQGCIMVIDFSEKKVQLCKGCCVGGGGKTWSCFTLPGLEGTMLDAVVGRDVQTMWVVTHNELEIIKYEI